MDILNPEQVVDVKDYYLIDIFPYKEHYGTYYSSKCYRPRHIRNYFRHVLDTHVTNVQVYSPVTTKCSYRKAMGRI